MFAVFQRKLFKNWLMILGWGIGLAFLGYWILDIFETMFQQNVDLQVLMNAYPEDLMAFFGGDVDIFSTSGFIQMEFFSYMPIILGIMTISAAAGVIARGEESGTLELTLAQPISRSGLFWGRLLASLLSLLLILVLAWVGFTLGITLNDFELTPLEMILPFISLFAILLVFHSLALFLSMVLADSGTANLISVILLIASFFITSFARIDERFEGINRFSPLYFYQGGAAVNGLDQQNLLLLIGISILLIILAWVTFSLRDLRFGGSGGLRLVLKRKG